MMGRGSTHIVSTDLFFDRAPTPCCVVNGAGRVLRSNASFDALLWPSAPSPGGQTLFNLARPVEPIPKLEEWLAGDTALCLAVETDTGREQQYSFVAAQVQGEAHYFVVGHPILDREMLRAKEEQLQFFVKYSPAAVAMFDRDLCYLEFSDRWLVDYRLEDRNIRGKSHYEIFPEVPDRWKKIHQRCLRGAVERCDEEIFPRLDGTVDWLSWEVRPWHLADGSIGGIMMLTEVITARKKADLAVEASESRFRTLFQTAPVGIFQTDTHGYCILANAAWSSISGLRVDPTHAVHWIGTLHPEDIHGVASRWRMAVRKKQRFEAEFRWSRPEGVEQWCRSTAAPLYGADGQVQGFIGTLVDVTERKEHEAVLQRMASTDELTGVFNRRAFEGAVRTEMARARRYGTGLSLLLLDLDRFKQVNDLHGHVFGDQVLQETARILQATVRLADTIARWGGEEFVVLLPETGLGDAAQFAERLRQRLGDIEHRIPGGGALSVTCSVGVSQYDPAMPDDIHLFATADAALYQAKETGRNRVCVAEVPKQA